MYRAESFPSSPAATEIFCIESGRLPPSACSSLRCSISRTGAPAFCDNAAAIAPALLAPNFAPNPPPMYSVITRTLVFGNLKSIAISSRTLLVDCVEAHTVSMSGFQSATTPWGSSAEWVWTWVRYSACDFDTALESTVLGSPLPLSFGPRDGPRTFPFWGTSSPPPPPPADSPWVAAPGYTSGASGLRASSTLSTKGSGSYSTFTRRAASTAAGYDVAATAAIG